jgi:hypothetical protein
MFVDKLDCYLDGPLGSTGSYATLRKVNHYLMHILAKP